MTGGRAYFDYAATAPLRPQAKAAMLEAFDIFGNASSVHGEGQRARALLDDARRVMAGLLGVRAERIVFTSGGTEANNLVMRGVAAKLAGKKILMSAVEHDCVMNTGIALGAEIIPVRADGVVDMVWLEQRLRKRDVGLVSVMHANNETGVMQPIREIATWARMTGAALHCDAVQTVGHIPIEVDKLEVDALSFSAHKFGGPKGVGAVVLKPEVKMEATVTGGAQERNRRAGTENVAGICGMAAAMRAAVDFMDKENVTARAIGAAIVKGLPAGVEVVSGAAKVPHMVQLRTPGKRGEDVVIGMDMRGVAVSQGSACSSGRVQASHVLKAMGFDDQAASEGVRLSWGWASSEAEVPAVLTALKGLVGA